MTIRTFPAITLWQPWASLSIAGVKLHETRGFALPRKHYGQWVAIHAAARPVQRAGMTEALWDLCGRTFGMDWHETLPLGRVVGIVRFTGCVSTSKERPTDRDDYVAGNWAPERWAWRMRDPVAIEQPGPVVIGRQGWFSVEVDVPPGDLRLDPRVPTESEVAAFGPGHLPRIAI